MSGIGASATRRCQNCQLVTSAPETFISERRSFRTTFRYFCPECWPKVVLRRQRRILWWYVAAGVAGLILTRIWPQGVPGWYLLNLAWLEASLILTVAPHEFAHAFAARALGLRIFRVLIGNGPKIWRGPIFGFDVEVRTVPFSGVVIAAPRDLQGYRWKSFLFVLAGPMANALLLGLAWVVHRSGPWLVSPASTFWIAWPIFALANAIVLVANLWPHRVRTALGLVPSDGRQLLNAILGQDHKTLEERHSAYFQLEAHTSTESKRLEEARGWIERGLAIYPANRALRSILAAQMLNAGDLERGRKINVSLLESQTISKIERAIFLNNIAYADALLGTNLDEADAFSQEAIAIGPWVRAFKNTRGTVLLALGRVDEALPILRAALPKAEEPPGHIAQCHCLLSVAEARHGNIEAAVRSLEIARAAEPDCFLLSRAEAAIAAARAPAPSPVVVA